MYLFFVSLYTRALQSLTISPYGEVLHLRSFTELERSLLCSYAM